MTLICWVHQELFWRFLTCHPALLSDIRYINCKFDVVCTLESNGVLWFIASTKFIPIAYFKQIVLLLIPNSVSLFRYVEEAWSRQVSSMSLSIMPWAYMKPVYVQKLASEVYPPDEGTSLTWKCAKTVLCRCELWFGNSKSGKFWRRPWNLMDSMDNQTGLFWEESAQGKGKGKLLRMECIFSSFLFHQTLWTRPLHLTNRLLDRVLTNQTLP